MTCEECLSELATGSLREMSGDSAVMQHCATCPDCSRLTTVLRDREYNAANVLNSLPPMSNPITLAETAVTTAHRRRVGRVVVMISGVALAVTIWFTAATLILPAMRGDGPPLSTLLTETIPLSCLSPQQAADIIDPYLRTHGSLYWVPKSGISAITVRGTAAQLSKSKDLIRNFESDRAAACRNTPAGSNKTPTASAERPEQKERP
ncbi:MAG TPA: hypothetical protein VF850_11605 [Gemmatimonadaceae bacterium]